MRVDLGFGRQDEIRSALKFVDNHQAVAMLIQEGDGIGEGRMSRLRVIEGVVVGIGIILRHHERESGFTDLAGSF
ncbi:hypothetical protein PH30N_06582 [Cutibacterium modestum 30N]|nr:hypothetical protein HMPREF9622_02778 [Cutibacterium modestum HL037PA3]MCP2377193.1 hypothetical protein [Cutibacterium modestum 28N]MCP2379088.1 hypothetical protein [Cutibacterium modestum 31N]MCP2380677.1 hypothetical protein [Cutibacterium modestum 30N]